MDVQTDQTPVNIVSLIVLKMLTTSQQKENDPRSGKLRRLSSITSITTPIGNIASKFRRPSTAVPPLKSGKTECSKKSLLPRNNRQTSGTSAQALRDTAMLPSAFPTARSRTPAQSENRVPKSQTTSNLSMLIRREPSYLPLPSSRSSTNLLKTRLPTPVGAKSVESLQTQKRGRDFMNLRKKSGSALPRFNTQPNLLSLGLNTQQRSRYKETLTGVREVAEHRRKTSGSAPGSALTSADGRLSMAFDTSDDKSGEIREENALRRPMWQYRNSGKPATAVRKSIEDEYEEMQPTLQTSPSKRIESDISPRRSLGGDIQCHQLMAPLAPPLPRLQTGHRDDPTTASLSSARLVRQVTQAQPPAYWSGRYTSLHDRLLNEATEVHPASSNPSAPSGPGSEEDSLFRLAGSAHGEAHAQRILDLLYSACMTEEAMRSLRIWQISFAQARQIPGLVNYTPTTAFASLVAGARSIVREPLVLKSTSGNGYYKASSDRRNAHLQEEEFSDELVAGSDASTVKALRDVSMEYLPEAGAYRKTSFIDRLLGGNRKVSGKMSVMGGAGFAGHENDRVGLLTK